ncbi:MAG: flagellin, partial [Desulfonatronospira sp. MSAO_Bac3]
MSLTINHNPMAMNAQRNLESHYGDLATSTRRLSSGLRVDTAADDAAGLAVRELMRADIAAMNQGVRNANDGISAIQTADGSLEVIDNKLIRMKELAEQAATGTYTADQREVIDGEYQQMKEEINRIARQTEFNQQKLIDGSVTGDDSLKVHFGPRDNFGEDYYHVDMGDATAAGLGIDNSYLRYTVEAPVENAQEIMGHVQDELEGDDWDRDSLEMHMNDALGHMKYAREELETADEKLDDDQWGDQVQQMKNLLDEAIENVEGDIERLQDGDEPEDVDDVVRNLGMLTDGGVADMEGVEIEEGAEYFVSIGGQEFNHEAEEGEDLEDVLEALAGQIDDEEGYSAEVDGDRLLITDGVGSEQVELFARDDLGTTNVQRDLNQSRELEESDFSVGPQGNNTDSDRVVDIDENGIDWEAVGGKEFSVTIGDDVISIEANDGDRADDIADALSTAINDFDGGDVYSTSGPDEGDTNFTIDQGAGKVNISFTGQIYDPTEQDVLVNSIQTTEGVDRTINFTNTGWEPIEGEEYSVTFAGDTFRYVAQEGDTSEDVAEGIADEIEASADYNAEHVSVTDGTITLGSDLNLGQEYISVAGETREDKDDVAINDTGNTEDFNRTLDFGNTDWEVVEGQNYQVTLGADTFDYEAEAGDSKEDVVRELAERINEDAGFTAESEGELITITKGAGEISDIDVDGLKQYDVGEAGSTSASPVDSEMANHIFTARAQEALETIDEAIEIKDRIRADLGAYQNRLDNTVSNLQIQAENLQAAESRISDVDVAQEMTEFTRNQVLSQGATAMLAQANTLPQMAMQLMG